MINPSLVRSSATKLEDENYKFRRFLKSHANEEELDKQFLDLQNELFANFDCGSCRNCCKDCSPVLKEDEIEPVSDFLKISKDDFITQYTENNCGECQLKGIPCEFLASDNTCRIEACKPQCCKEYPHTDKPGRLWSLLGIVESASVCPGCV